MVNGLKECSVRDTQGDSTKFKDATSFANPTAFQGFSIAAMADDGAWHLEAIIALQ